MAVEWTKIALEGSSPSFSTVKLTGLTDGFVPYHVADATGLANGPVYTDGTNIAIGDTPATILSAFTAAAATGGNNLYIGNDTATGTNTGVVVTMTGAGDANYGLYIDSAGATANYAIYSTRGTNVLNESSGSTIIGTTALSGTEKLRVNGTSYFDDNVVSAGDIEIKNGQEIRLWDAGSSHYVGFEAPALTANQVWTLPSTDGTAGYCLVTDGSGVLSWAENGSGSATDTFKTIACPAGSNPVADSATDTLTFTAAGGLVITGDSATDTVAFSTSGLISTSGLSADWDAGSYKIRAETFESDVATGTAPLTIASTTKVANLNADQLDGIDSTGFIQVTGTSTLTGAVTIAGAYNIDLSSYNMVYVAPGTDVLSDAVDAMSNGDCIVLGAGTYYQDDDVTLKDGVTDFAIVGQGSSVTTVYFNNQTDGIVGHPKHYTIGASNNKIDFKEAGGAEITATIRSGDYGTSMLCWEIGRQMTATSLASGDGSTYTCADTVISAGTYKFKISRPSGDGNFEILWITGASGNSIAATLGYTADDAGTYTYTADTATLVDQYRLRRAKISGLKLVYGSGTDGTGKYGIRLWGTTDNVYSSPSIALDDICINHTSNKRWATAVCLTDSHIPYLNRVHIRNNSNARTADGIVFESCMGGMIHDSNVVSSRYGVHFKQASIHDTWDSGIYHGTEGCLVRDTSIYISDIGVYVTDKCLANKFINVGIPRPKTNGFKEYWTIYTITSAVGDGSNLVLTIGSHNFAPGDSVWVWDTTNFDGQYYGASVITDITSTTITLPSATTATETPITAYCCAFQARGWNLLDGVYVDVDTNFTGIHEIYINCPGTEALKCYASGQTDDAGTYLVVNGITVDSTEGNGTAANNIISGNTLRAFGHGGGAGVYHLSSHGIISQNTFTESQAGGYNVNIPAAAYHKNLVTGNMLDLTINDSGTDDTVSNNVTY